MIDQKAGHGFGTAFSDASIVALPKFRPKCGNGLPIIERIYSSVSSLSLSGGASDCVRLCRSIPAGKQKNRDEDKITDEHGFCVHAGDGRNAPVIAGYPVTSMVVSGSPAMAFLIANMASSEVRIQPMVGC